MYCELAKWHKMNASMLFQKGFVTATVIIDINSHIMHYSHHPDIQNSFKAVVEKIQV